MHSNLIRKNPSLSAVCVLILLLILTIPRAHANILVAPTRITLEEGQRVGQVAVMNPGSEPVTLRLSFVNYHMQADGTLVESEVALPGEFFADGFLQHSPRRIQLAPGEEQTVRVLARPPSGPAREYRSHLRFQAEPPPRPQQEDSLGPTRELEIQIQPLYGVSIPVIVRTGDLNASAGIENISLDRGPNGLLVGFQLTRSGDRSVYGDFRVTFRPAGGEPRVIAQTRGVAVYPPLQAREVRLPLTESLSAGTLRVEYLDNSDERKVIASAERQIR